MIAKNRKPMAPSAPTFRCAVYTRKSTEDGLEQEFNSLDAQRDAGESYVKSQVAEGWQCLADRYDDGGFTGGNMDRPALRRLLADIEAGKVDCVVVYKVDRLSRSLLDFARMMETFDKHGVSFVSVTQQFNTASSMGRLVLNVLLSFAQFEREMISERTRDKIAAARRKGKWVGGMPLLGYNVVDSKLVVDLDEAEQVRQIFALYLQQDGLIPAVQELNRRDWRTKKWTTKKASSRGGQPFTKNRLWRLLTNVAYIGKLRYKDEIHDAEHQPIVSPDAWQKTQAKLARQGRTGGREVRNKFGAILKGLIHCTACGCAMSPSHSTQEGRRYRYYVCQNAQKRGWHECLAPSLPAGEVERFVVEQIKCIGRDPAIVAETVRQVRGQASERIDELQTEERRLVRELAEYQRDLRRLTANPNASPGAVVPQALVHFQLLGDLLLGGSAPAVILTWDGSAWVPGNTTIAVDDWYANPGMWQAYAGYKGLALKNACHDRYEIVWMETPARSIEFVLTSALNLVSVRL
ncbi:MAG: recombinase family protein [Pirellulales bacterium]